MKTNQLITIADLPSPKGNFLLGQLLQFNTKKQHDIFSKWIREIGEIFKIHFAGKQFVVCAQPNIVSEILKLRPHKFRRFPIVKEMLNEFGVEGVFTAEGDEWIKHRKPITEALKAKNVREFYPTICNKTESLMGKLLKISENNEAADIKREFMAFAIDTTTIFSFGYDLDIINKNEHEFQKHLDAIFEMASERLLSPIPIWRYYKRKKDKDFDRSISLVRDTIYEFMEEAKRNVNENPELKENPRNLLESLYAVDEEERLSDQHIYGNVFIMLFAGEETTSNSLSWMVNFLCQHPEKIQKVRDEANAIYPNNLAPKDKETLSQLKYANALVQEGLRMQPTIPLLYLTAVEDITIENFKIPKGTNIFTHFGHGQLKEEFFTQPDEFIPERWIDSKDGGCPMANHHPKKVQAFGGGPRFCPGKYMAIDEMVAVISSFCKNFDFKHTSDPQKLEGEFVWTLAPKDLFLKLKATSEFSQTLYS